MKAQNVHGLYQVRQGYSVYENGILGTDSCQVFELASLIKHISISSIFEILKF